MRNTSLQCNLFPCTTYSYTYILVLLDDHACMREFVDLTVVSCMLHSAFMKLRMPSRNCAGARTDSINLLQSKRKVQGETPESTIRVSDWLTSNNVAPGIKHDRHQEWHKRSPFDRVWMSLVSFFPVLLGVSPSTSYSGVKRFLGA